MPEINEMKNRLDDICKHSKENKKLVGHRETEHLLTAIKIILQNDRQLIDKIIECYCKDQQEDISSISAQFNGHFRSRIEIFCYVWETSEDTELKRSMLESYSKARKEIIDPVL